VKKIESRLIFGEVIRKSLMSCFLTHCVANACSRVAEVRFANGVQFSCSVHML